MERWRKVQQEGKAIKDLEKVRGRGEERGARTGDCRERGAERGARDPRCSGHAGWRRPAPPALWVGGQASGAWVPAGRRSRRRRRRRRCGRGGGRARAGCARQGRQAPCSGAFVLCRGKQAAPAWRWPSAGASSGAPRARGLATRETGPLSPLLSRAGLRDRRSRRRAE